MLILATHLIVRHCNNSWVLADKLKAIMSNGLPFITYSIEMGHVMPVCHIWSYADTRPYIFGFSNIERKKLTLILCQKK